MESSPSFGFLLVGFSAVLVASHWQKWRAMVPQSLNDQRQQRFFQRQIRRRMQASGLIGLVGFALVTLHRLPHSPVVMTFYLLGLIAATCWILCLAVTDVWATRHFHQQQQIEQTTGELHRAKNSREA